MTKPMVKIIHATWLRDYRIKLTFSDGLEGVFDLAAYLRNNRGALLTPLNDESCASQFTLEAGALSWPHGLQLSPRRLYELCLLPGAA